MRFRYFFVLSLLSSQTIYANPPTVKGDFFASPQPVHESIRFVRLKDGAVLYDKNGSQVATPASVVKVVTSAAMLYFLDPNVTIDTKLYYEGKKANGTVQGALCIKGGGDPFFVSEHLWQIAADMKHMGFRQFNGGIVIDNGLFDSETRNAAREEGMNAASFAYDAPVTAFGVNFNTVTLAVAPAENAGLPAFVSTDPFALRDISINGKVMTVAPNKKTAVQATRVSEPSGTKLDVNGQIPIGTSLTKVYRSINDPISTPGEYVRAFLENQNIHVKGAIRAGTCSDSAKLILTHESEPLSKLVRSLNLFSNNYIADVLTKRLAAAYAKPNEPATLAAGVQILREFLDQHVKASGGYTLQDGSGLSTANKLSAEQLTAVLTFMATRFESFPEFMASLPSSGNSGSLKKRFKSLETAALLGSVRAKTGTLSQPVTVVALAGYLDHPKHGIIAFAIIQNGVAGKPQPPILDVRLKHEVGLKDLFKAL